MPINVSSSGLKKGSLPSSIRFLAWSNALSIIYCGISFSEVLLRKISSSSLVELLTTRGKSVSSPLTISPAVTENSDMGRSSVPILPQNPIPFRVPHLELEVSTPSTLNRLGFPNIVSSPGTGEIDVLPQLSGYSSGDNGGSYSLTDGNWDFSDISTAYFPNFFPFKLDNLFANSGLRVSNILYCFKVELLSFKS